MAIDRNEFRDTLKRKSGADDGAIDIVMTKVEPFFIYADAGNYRFADADTIRKSDVAHAIRTALGAPVRKIEVVSVSNPWDDWPPYFNENIIRTSLLIFLKRGLMQVLPHKIMDVHYPFLKQHLVGMAMSPYQLEEIIKDATQKALWKSLKKACETSFGPMSGLGRGTDSSDEDSIWPDDLWRELYRCIYYSLTCYMGYVLSGLPEKAAEFEPLIDLMPSTIPVGAIRFKQSTYITFAG